MLPADTTTRFWFDELPPLQGRMPPYPLHLADLQKATEEMGTRIERPGIGELSPRQRDERLEKTPIEAIFCVAAVEAALLRHAALFQGAPFGADEMNAAEQEIEGLGSLRRAAEALRQAVEDTLLDRQARRYILCSYLVDDLKALARSASTPADLRREANAALQPILAIEKARARGHTEPGPRDWPSRLAARVAVLQWENQALRQKLQQREAAIGLQVPR